jgi:hypothetical protein
MGSVAVALMVGLALIGLIVTVRFLSLETRRKHNEFAGFNSALIGVIFAVLLAFIAVSAWGSFDKSGDDAEVEASLAGDLFNDASTMPEPARTDLVGDMRDYVDIVLNQEWPAMAVGASFGDDGWAPLYRFHKSLTQVQTENPVQVAMIAETLRRLNSLYDARRDRILASNGHINPTVWWVVLLGSAITVVFTYFFGMENFKIHLTMTGLVAGALALVIVLIVAFDFPFRGQVQVTPDGFKNVEHTMEMAGIKFVRAGQ